MKKIIAEAWLSYINLNRVIFMEPYINNSLGNKCNRTAPIAGLPIFNDWNVIHSEDHA